MGKEQSEKPYFEQSLQEFRNSIEESQFAVMSQHVLNQTSTLMNNLENFVFKETFLEIHFIESTASKSEFVCF